MGRAYLETAQVKPLDGDGDAVPFGIERADVALVDAAEPALAELLRAAEVVGGGPELLELERPQLAVAPLLVQLRDAPLRHGRRPRRRRRRLAHRPHRPRVVRPARAHRRSRRRGRARRAPPPAPGLPPLEPPQAAHFSAYSAPQAPTPPARPAISR